MDALLQEHEELSFVNVAEFIGDPRAYFEDDRNQMLLLDLLALHNDGVDLVVALLIGAAHAALSSRRLQHTRPFLTGTLGACLLGRFLRLEALQEQLQ